MAGLTKLIEDILKLCEVKSGDKVLLYTGQRARDEATFGAWTEALNNLDTDFFEVIMPNKDVNKKLVNVGQGPLATELFKETDFVFNVTSTNMLGSENAANTPGLHGPEFQEIREANPSLRWLMVNISFPELNYRRLFPSQMMLKRIYAGAKVMAKAKEIKITSKSGTDLTCERAPGKDLAVERLGGYQIGLVNKNHTWDNYGCGNVQTHPIDDSANGVIVVDSGNHMNYPGIPFWTMHLVREPYKITFKDGKITKIEGGVEAKIYTKLIAENTNEKNPGIRGIAHIGWGCFEKGVDPSNYLYCTPDHEGVFGTIMIHFGGYLGIGGYHLSGPTLKDTDFYLDGEPIVKNNDIVHPECK